MGDKNKCQCGYDGVVSSDKPPFWELNGQIWHFDCLVAAHPQYKEWLENRRDAYMRANPPWVARITFSD